MQTPEQAQVELSYWALWYGCTRGDVMRLSGVPVPMRDIRAMASTGPNILARLRQDGAPESSVPVERAGWSEIPERARAIERAVVACGRCLPLPGLVLRTRYCLREPMGGKLELLGELVPLIAPRESGAVSKGRLRTQAFHKWLGMGEAFVLATMTRIAA